MKTSFTPEEMEQIENESYEVGIAVGERTERKRIVELLKLEVSEWLSHDGECDCKTRGEEGLRLIARVEADIEANEDEVLNEQ
jgi:hypothetical protein